MTQISLIAGIILAVLGGWIILNPQILIMVIPVVMGVIVAVHGVHNLLQALELFKNEYSKWWVALLLGAVTVGLGVLLIFKAVNTVIMLIGIFLIYDGISDLWIISRVSKTAREIRETVEALDVTDKSE